MIKVQKRKQKNLFKRKSESEGEKESEIENSILENFSDFDVTVRDKKTVQIDQVSARIIQIIV